MDSAIAELTVSTSASSSGAVAAVVVLADRSGRRRAPVRFREPFRPRTPMTSATARQSAESPLAKSRVPKKRSPSLPERNGFRNGSAVRVARRRVQPSSFTHAVASGKPPPFFARAPRRKPSASVASGPQSSGLRDSPPMTASRRRDGARRPMQQPNPAFNSARALAARPPAPPAYSTPRGGWGPGDGGVYSGFIRVSRRAARSPFAPETPETPAPAPGRRFNAVLGTFVAARSPVSYTAAPTRPMPVPIPPATVPRRCSRHPPTAAATRPAPSTPWSAASTRSRPRFRPSRAPLSGDDLARRRRRAVNT